MPLPTTIVKVIQPDSTWVVFTHLLMGCVLFIGCSKTGSWHRSDATNSTPEHRAYLDRALPLTPVQFRAVTLDARHPPDGAILLRLQALGVKQITLITFGFQENPASPHIRMNPDARWYSESDAGIRTLAQQAAALGIETIIKPHIWVGGYNPEGQTRDRIGFSTEGEWAQWEASYRQFILHYAYLSQEIKAPLFVIGTELAHVAKSRPNFWRSLIAEIRHVYSGPLTYAGNWYAEYEEISFWDALDFIGVQAYFELSKEDNPTLRDMVSGWEPHLEALQQLARSTGKPVLFTELGYRSVPYAAAQPWRWPEREESVPSDTTLQALLYQAFFEQVWSETWFAGAILWKWHPTENAQHPGRARDFTPQFKPAETIIGTWFNQSAILPTR